MTERWSDEPYDADDGDRSWIQWQDMSSYPEGRLVLTRDAKDRPLFGRRREGVWHQFIDGEDYPKPGHVPVQWTEVPDERIDAWAFG